MRSYSVDNIYTPFTYRITFKLTGQHYYGVRTRRGCHPGELWTNYFTSSKKIKRLITEHGVDSFIFEIRKTFSDKASAIEWEHRVLKRLDVVNNEHWFNENIGGKYFVTKDHLTEEHRRNVSLAQTGKKKKPHSEQGKRNISAARKGQPAHNKGKPMFEAQKKLMSQIRSGTKSSDETRAKISAGLRGRVQSPETRAKMAEKRRLYWENKRALSGSI